MPAPSSPPDPNVRIRPLARGTDREAAELDLVALRMGLTLIEVLGPARGAALYTREWLRDRARFHIDPTRSTGEIFLAELMSNASPRSDTSITSPTSSASEIVGHTIVRLEDDEAGAFGLFSTTWVDPAHRRLRVADRLVDGGEAWFRGHGVTRFATDTSDANTALLALFSRRGYAVTFRAPDLGMVRLTSQE